MQEEPDLHELLRGLQTALRRAGLTLAEASRKLEHSPTYLSLVFRRRLKLKVREAFELIELARLQPWEFFDICFPLGGAGFADLRARYHEREASELAKLPDTRGLLLAKLRQDPRLPVDPAEWAARTGALLREKIAAAGASQRNLSVTLGYSPVALGLALRGNSRLTFLHVFGVLRELGITPARFFTELVLQEGELAESLRWSELLDKIEHVLIEAAKGVARLAPPK